MRHNLFVILIILCGHLSSQEIIIRASQEKEFVIADFINAQVIYQNLSENQINELRSYKNKYITNDLLLVEVLSEGPPDEFLFIASFSKDEHNLTLGGEEVKINYDNFKIDASSNSPPNKFNYNFLSSELLERY
ncbi:hypothetical protein N9N67_08280, partial [Bacteriovoracaceae bacterium]|nr:hypothetical protein [Bacteriovoracaceae bacterium]